MANVENGERRKRNLSPEAREKLSKLAKQRHAEGKFGGPEFGKLGGKNKTGTGKKQRITKRVAEAAMEEENAKAIVNVFRDAIHPSQPMATRLKGAEAWARIAHEQAKMENQEVRDENQVRTREELIEMIRGKLTSGPAAAILRAQIEQETGIVDAEVVEEEEDGLSAAA